MFKKIKEGFEGVGLFIYLVAAFLFYLTLLPVGKFFGKMGRGEE
jgi:hypothetical protein